MKFGKLTNRRLPSNSLNDSNMKAWVLFTHWHDIIAHSATQSLKNKKIGKNSKKCLRVTVHGFLSPRPPTRFIFFAWEKDNRGIFFVLGGGNQNVDVQTSYSSIPFLTNPSPLINSPNQNEIVGRFPGRVHSLVVRLFPVWTPSQSQTVAMNLCGVNGLVAVHWPNLRKTTSWQHDTPIQKNNDNLPSSIRRRMNKRPNISSFRPMPYQIYIYIYP